VTRAAPGAADLEANRPAGAGRLRWGQTPLAFELASVEAECLRRAGIVFRPWMDSAPGAPNRRWSIERTASGEWLVHDARSPAPITRPTVEAAVRAVELLAAGALFECAETTTLHAALVARGGRGIAILGAGETGKSTLATALWQRGWSLLGDDLVVVDPLDTRAWPVPRRVSLRFRSRDLLGDALWRRLLQTPAGEVTEEGCLFHPDEVDARPRPHHVRLVALVFLGRRDAAPGPARARQLPAAQALLAVLPYSNVIRRADAGATIRHFQPLLTRLPAHDLGRGTIDAMTETMDRLLPGTAA
jgi:hypothetical protein